MVIYILYRLGRLGQLVLPRAAFLATYEPSCEQDRIQGERERNLARRAAWRARQLTSGNK